MSLEPVQSTSKAISSVGNCSKARISGCKEQQLQYGIDSWSSHSAQYHPRNIIINKPQEQSSRWSSGSNNQMQYVTVKLDKLSVVHTITFGKYHKVHVCNLKEFKVFGGLNKNNMIELLHSGLRNDDEPETFPLKHKTMDVVFPCLYIKIMPLMAWGANFNFSIWYVQLQGISDKDIVDDALMHYNAFREKEAVRLCLKHFRQRNYLDTFDSLQKRTKICLENPILTDLHTKLVLSGDFEACEDIMKSAAGDSLFDDYISDCTYTPVWTRITPVNLDGQASSEYPGMRGGHQMCMEASEGKLFLFGGWDGQKDLVDLWMYDIADNRWEKLSDDTREQGGPGPRSCHKMCYDSVRRRIYTLGRYVDPESRATSNLKSDFFRYDIQLGTWAQLSANTANEGGPELIYDHQMCVDTEKEQIYVFGGRTISSSNSENVYSGLYLYDCKTEKWSLLRSDGNQPQNSIQLKSRIGHSMLLNSQTRQLYIFAGQRNKDYLSDFYIYDIDSQIVHEMSRDSSKQGGPDAGFTQRATIDKDLNEVFVLSGLMREKNSTQETVKNSFWVYNLKKDKWTRIYQNEHVDQEYWNKMGNVEPCPRFAHQLVYDSRNKVHYLFGGNPGDTGNPKTRLDDFWSLKLVRPNTAKILKRSQFLIRKQKFRELCLVDSMEALKYLQNDLAETVNHESKKESAEFRSLTSTLFQQKRISSCAGSSVGSPPDDSKMVPESPVSVNLSLSGVEHNDHYKRRTQLYEELLQFFPEHMKQPKGNLIDLLSL
eukprot:Nk52_evm11s301 gene=Nk52_evmTU11s301